MNTKLIVGLVLLVVIICNAGVDARHRSRGRGWLGGRRGRACPRNYCKNGGVCTRLWGSKFYCKCCPGFTGPRCECEIDECATANPCQFNSLCINNIGGPGVTCTCPTGFTGTCCETNIDDCAANSCKNNGTCVDGINSFSCQCPDNYKGEFCELFCTVMFETKLGANVLFPNFEEFLIPEANCTTDICSKPCVIDYSTKCFTFFAPMLSAQRFASTNPTDDCNDICRNDPNCKSADVIDQGAVFVCYTFSVSTAELGTTGDDETSSVSDKIESCIVKS